jgi:hypothetical protein
MLHVLRYHEDKNNALSMWLNDTPITQVVVFWDVTSRSHIGANVAEETSALIFRLP